MKRKPLCIDLYCGLGGWAEGFLAEGWDVIGFDIERHDYGTGGYPGQLVLQDVLTLHGSQFKDAAVIVASPPCQAYSYRAMPFGSLWREHNQMDDDGAPVGNYSGKDPISNALFRACFRISSEARCPIVIENVRGAEAFMGPARWKFGSFYLWGDLPALMPFGGKSKRPGIKLSKGFNNWPKDEAGKYLMSDGTKVGGGWFGKGNNRSLMRQHSSRSLARKSASAQIAKIPFPLAQHIARTFKP